MVHKCCGGRKKGQALEFRFLHLPALAKISGSPLFCFGSSLVEFSNNYTLLESGYYRKGYSNINEHYMVSPTNIYTKSTSGGGEDNNSQFLNHPNPCDSKSKITESLYRSQTTGVKRWNNIIQNYDVWRNRCDIIEQSGSAQTYGVGDYRGSCYSKEQLLNTDFVEVNNNVSVRHNVSIRGLGFAVIAKVFGFSIKSLVGGRIYYPDNPNRGQNLQTLNKCVKLNLTRNQIDYEGIQIVKQGDSILIKVGDSLVNRVSTPKNTKFISYRFIECGCAKDEIECIMNGQVCCINCCEIAKELYNKYSEVYR